MFVREEIGKKREKGGGGGKKSQRGQGGQLPLSRSHYLLKSKQGGDRIHNLRNKKKGEDSDRSVRVPVFPVEHSEADGRRGKQ